MQRKKGYVTRNLFYGFIIKGKPGLQFLCNHPGETIVQALAGNAEAAAPHQLGISLAAQYLADNTSYLFMARTNHLLDNNTESAGWLHHLASHDLTLQR